jgi:hypothetical protein
MLVIISDTHLTDGTSGQTVQWGAFRAFREELSDLAYDASWRRDGSYKPIEELHLVLLGDILDVIRSTRWLVEYGKPSEVKPWSDLQSPLFSGKVMSITAEILKNNAESLATLKDLHSTITVPEATADGKAADAEWQPKGKNRRPVKVYIYYLVGNHDWFFHLSGEPYDRIRQTVVEAMGLENSSNMPFPHDPLEWDVIQQIYSDHQVFARHGDIFDPLNYEGDRNRSSLGDVIVVELVDRFSMTVREKMGDVLPRATIDGLKEIDNLRPTFIIPVWVDSLLKRTCPDTGLQMDVKRMWDRLVDDLLALDFVHKHQSFFHLFDSVDQLEWGLKFSKGVSRGNLSHLFSSIAAKFGDHESSYFPQAAAETAFKNRTARCFVYGHTHVYEMVPLDSVVVNNSFFDQIYINSGTWRPYHQLCWVHPEHEEFVKFQLMTYLGFFKGDECAGRRFEAWTGVLGARPSEDRL